ncbi:hypothetical protein DOY81_007255 [Sarcophaga bullata]|nr:hypothetical protein DOY81_007255 [Sarcophaga bullata]
MLSYQQQQQQNLSSIEIADWDWFHLFDPRWIMINLQQFYEETNQAGDLGNSPGTIFYNMDCVSILWPAKKLNALTSSSFLCPVVNTYCVGIMATKKVSIN